MKYYAKSKENVMDFLDAEYGIDIITRRGGRVFLKNGMIADFGSIECSCGETYGCYINDGTDIVICESCYDNAEFHERI